MFKFVYEILVLSPLRTVYMYGPEFHGFGFWGGRSDAQICAVLTGTAEKFWNSNENECTSLIEQKFYSIQVTVESVVYFTSIFYLLKTLSECITRRFRTRRRYHVQYIDEIISPEKKTRLLY